MAEKEINKRIKKWFKEMTPEKKKELCDYFKITEDNLKKAGFADEDGNVYIDLLKLHYSAPKEWSEFTDYVVDSSFLDIVSKMKEYVGKKDYQGILDSFKQMYAIKDKNIKFKKLNISYKSEWRILQTANIIIKKVEMVQEAENDESKSVFSRLIFQHLDLFFKDFDLFKK